MKSFYKLFFWVFFGVPVFCVFLLNTLPNSLKAENNINKSNENEFNNTQKTSEKNNSEQLIKKFIDNPEDYITNKSANVLFRNTSYHAKEVIFHKAPKDLRLKVVLLLEFFKLKDELNIFNCMIYVKKGGKIEYAVYGLNNKLFFYEINDFINKLPRSFTGLSLSKDDYIFESPDYCGTIFDFSKGSNKVQIKINKNFDYSNSYEISLSAMFNENYRESKYANIIFYDREGFPISSHRYLTIKQNLSNSEPYRYLIKDLILIEKEIFYSIHSVEIDIN